MTDVPYFVDLYSRNLFFRQLLTYFRSYLNHIGAVYIVRAQHRGRGGFSLAHPSTQGGRGGLGPSHMCMWEKILRPLL